MKFVLALVISVLSTTALAQTTSEVVESASGDILRVGGDYTVTAIDKLGEKAFKVEFTSATPSGKFDTLYLESDHVHVAVKVGQKIRLSAEILAQKGAAADVAQVVVFLPSGIGQTSHVPVWLLSNKAPPRDLRASKYLEMHVPATDFVVM
jgi:hypothetical protein